MHIVDVKNLKIVPPKNESGSYETAPDMPKMHCVTVIVGKRAAGKSVAAVNLIEKMGYDKNLLDDKMRLVENPKKFMEEFIESILSKRNNYEFVKKNNDNDIEINEINPVIKKQINSLKNSIESNGLSVDQVIKMLQKEDE